ncbi:MAG: VWA domain-containing protein [Acidobacteria bacterium]|nr:VWA domain-containing protein [Acidobacteriota bacterium]
MEVIQKDYGIGITDAPCAIAKSYPSEPSVDESYLNEENRDGDVDPNVLDRKEAKADERRKFQLGKLKEEWLTQQQAYLNLPSPERKMAIQQIETKINQLRDELGWSNTESYAVIAENPFLDPQHDPLSTFSIDVDTASYSNLRRFLNQGQLPPPGAIRIEELINYFDYAYPTPDPGQPFSASVEVTSAPWNEAHRIARIGLKGYEVDPASRPACNLVFLVDVSGSMENPNKLPLVQSSLTKLVNHLRGDDSVALVVYAGSSGTLLDPTPVSQKATIVQAIQQLSAGGSTQGSAGIEAAYALAQSAFKKDGINRIILATDGDFNVGISDNSSLEKLISEKAKGGVFLTVLGFGMGNYQDSTLELLADKGNGFYAYIDSEVEADKVMVHQLTGTLMTIAKDVKIQVEFNPQAVSSYRLIGYENRKMAARDFNDDSKDAGEIGAGHTVTALYEIVPVDQASKAGSIDPLKYQAQAEPTADAFSNELLTVKIRYKKPDSDTSQLLSFPVSDSYQKLEETSADTQFALAVACFGLNLRGSAIQTPWPKVQKWLKAASTDPLRLEFQTLVEKAIALQ